MNTNQPGSPIDFGAAQPTEQQAALRLLVSTRFGSVNTEHRWWHYLQSAAEQGLIVARQSGNVVGAIWAQPIMDCIVALWPPATTLTKQSESQTVRGGLLRAMESYLVSSEVELARALVTEDDTTFNAQLELLGCQPVAMIESMYWTAEPFDQPNARADQLSVTFEACQADKLGRLESVMQQTYEGSMDCKAIRHVIRAERVLKSYAAAPNADSSLWFVAAIEGKDIGCVIVADDDEDEQCELMFMGIVPEFRGRGLGASLISRAKRLALDRKRRRITVAVDRANYPAVKVYEDAGFITFAEQKLVGRVFDRKS